MYSIQVAASTYCDDPSDVERLVATIGFQHDFTTPVFCLVYVCKSPGGYWVLADEIDVLWAEPTTGRQHGGPEVLNHPCVMLREGCVIRVWSRTPNLESRLSGGRFPGNQGLSPAGDTKLREERHESEGGRGREEGLYTWTGLGFILYVLSPFNSP